ncbi:MAG: hypothetical protein Q9162_005901 [Coniocarpon cinnabarinum]
MSDKTRVSLIGLLQGGDLMLTSSTPVLQFIQEYLPSWAEAFFPAEDRASVEAEAIPRPSASPLPASEDAVMTPAPDVAEDASTIIEAQQGASGEKHSAEVQVQRLDRAISNAQALAATLARLRHERPDIAVGIFSMLPPHFRHDLASDDTANTVANLASVLDSLSSLQQP